MTFWYSTPEDFAAAVLGALKEDERTPEWLARQTGIPSSTLRAQLLVKPSRITLINALRIAQHVPSIREVA